MQQITPDNPISNQELTKIAQKMFGSLTKAVVDIRKNIMLIDAEFHADQEQSLLREGSHQQDLWGINLYPTKHQTPDFVEFDSMINLRPHDNNRSRGVDDINIQKQIIQLVDTLITK